MTLPKVTDAQQIKNAEATYLNLIASWQIDITPEVRSFVNKAVMAGVSSTAFLQSVRQTKFYAKRFPGIMKGGTMRMTEAQYISGYEQARNFAASVGRNLTRDMYGMAIKNGNSPSEIQDKLDAANKLRMYRPMFRQFSDYLQATGRTKKPLEAKDMLSFIMGQGPREWHDAYRTAYAATQAENLGFDVGKPKTGADIGYRDLAKIAADIEVMGQGGDYTGVLAAADKVLPAGDWKALGLTSKDRVRLAMGAPGERTAAAAKRVAQAVNVRVAQLTEPQANPNVLTNVQQARQQAPQVSE